MVIKALCKNSVSDVGVYFISTVTDSAHYPTLCFHQRFKNAFINLKFDFISYIRTL